MRGFARREPTPVPVPAGEKVLAWARSGGGAVAGTRDALYVLTDLAGEPVRVPWEQVEAADWDLEAEVLRVTEVGSWGEPKPEHVLTLDAPGALLQLVRERVTASVVLQRHVPVRGSRGVRVIARRAPHGDRPLTWLFAYDEGVDPADPDVRRVAEEALAAARTEVGDL